MEDVDIFPLYETTIIIKIPNNVVKKKEKNN